MDTEKKQKRTVGQLGLDTRVLRDRLLRAGTGEKVSYDELSALIKRDVRTDARSNLGSARRILQSEYQIVFSVVRTEGLVRLTDAENVESAAADATRAVPRAARRVAKRMTAVRDFDALPNETKIQHNAGLCYLQTVGALAKQKPMKQLELEVAKANSVLSIAATLAALSPNQEGEPRADVPKP